MTLVYHQPVLLKEVLKYLNPISGENFIDCTVGFGGHALMILKKIAPQGKLLGIELDREVLKKLKARFKGSKLKENIILISGNFADLEEIVKENSLYPINGILFDLGISSWQIEKSGRGFSFQKDEPLDMRFDPSRISADKIVNQWPEDALAGILKEYGEEKYAYRIARLICLERQKSPIKTTGRLKDIIGRAVPKKYRYQKIHFATRTFQAIRIATNDELGNLEKSLPQALKVLSKDGRMAVISFHSLEDRIVKNFFKQQAKENNLEILTKKPIRPAQEEIKSNPRSRSAKLRAVKKL